MIVAVRCRIDPAVLVRDLTEQVFVESVVKHARQAPNMSLEAFGTLLLLRLASALFLNSKLLLVVGSFLGET